MIKIKKATLKYFKELYELGLNTPELKVSATEDFMDPKEFEFSIENKYGNILIKREYNFIILIFRFLLFRL